MSSARTLPNRPDLFLIIALAISLLANVGMLLVARNRPSPFSLANNNGHVRVLPEVGTRLDTLTLVDLSGTKLDIKENPGNLPIVVYVLSPTCGWCKLNKKNIESLVSQKQSQFRFIGISTSAEGLSEYVAKTSPPFPVYTVDPSQPHESIKLSTTPETLVFSSGGAYVTGWEGAYIGNTLNQVASYFNITLLR